MKRVDLVEYFELGEALQTARRATGMSATRVGSIYVNTYQLPHLLRRFIEDDNGFSASKRVATELITTLSDWRREYVDNGGDDAFDKELNSWQFSSINSKIEVLKNVFQAESRDVDVYSVSQISIYKTSELVSNGAGVIPPEIQRHVPAAALGEFNNAGKCLAFDLPTACGFHSLRALELVMHEYLTSFGVKTTTMRSWNDYIKAAQKLIADEKIKCKPSSKVAAMLDRMRELDRNPLMHPRDTLDIVSADMLFRLCAITVVEIARDQLQKKTSLESAPKQIFGPLAGVSPDDDEEVVPFMEQGA